VTHLPPSGRRPSGSAADLDAQTLEESGAHAPTVRDPSVRAAHAPVDETMPALERHRLVARAPHVEEATEPSALPDARGLGSMRRSPEEESTLASHSTRGGRRRSHALEIAGFAMLGAAAVLAAFSAYQAASAAGHGLAGTADAARMAQSMVASAAYAQLCMLGVVALVLTALASSARRTATRAALLAVGGLALAGAIVRLVALPMGF
jgi:hypothetical protein